MRGRNCTASADDLRTPHDIVVVGASWGGLHALQVVLRCLPGNLAAPIIVVQHRGKSSDDTLALLLQPHSALAVGEVEDKDPIQPARVYLAPPDYHLLVEDDRLALSTGEPVNYARPSIDVLFESAADAYGERVTGVILTGATSDGARGMAAIKRRGGLALVQDPTTAEVGTMPQAAIAATKVDRVLSLEGIGTFLAEHCVKREE